MITPRFSLSQDETFLTLKIRAPYCSLKDIEIYVDNNDFRFVCPPYYLRLNLSGNIIQNDASTGEYLSDSGEFLLKYQKVVQGQHFEGLDFVTSLLQAPKKAVKPAQIEVLSAEDATEPEDENEWYIEQKLPEHSPPTLTTNKYGFASQKSDILCETESEYYSVFDVRDAEKLPQIERRNLRFDTESMDFSADHYLADMFDDSTIRDLIDRENPWRQLDKATIQLNDREKDLLKDFPNKEYLLDERELNEVLLGLTDILFAYSYDKRTTDFEENCESGWTITKISATLSWFDVYNTEKDVIISAFRRCLIYPLYRNFKLCQTVLNDLQLLFDLGPVFIVKSLLDIYDIFNASPDPRYILNDLYLKDYIIFMQKCPKIRLEQLRTSLAGVTIDKDELRLDLAQIVRETVAPSESLLTKMSKLNLSETDSDSESESSDDDDDDESDSSSESSSSGCLFE